MTAALLDWPAPAKLNLFLHINARRADGYHELQTLFQFLDMGDRLSFFPREDSEITIEPAIDGVATEDNLIYKAALKLRALTGCDLGATIKLKKRLPMGGGIGGGSSNAATALHALNLLWQLNLDTETLARMGLELGADVPVFVHGHAAFAEGVGEKFTPMQPETPWYLVLVPNCHVSTAVVFGDPGLPRNTPRLTSLPEDPWQLKNDCQSLVCEHYPEVENALSWLLEYAPSRMTGTGSCVFGRFDSKKQAENALSKLPQGMRGFVAKGMNRSPLLDMF